MIVIGISLWFVFRSATFDQQVIPFVCQYSDTPSHPLSSIAIGKLATIPFTLNWHPCFYFVALCCIGMPFLPLVSVCITSARIHRQAFIAR